MKKEDLKLLAQETIEISKKINTENSNYILFDKPIKLNTTPNKSKAKIELFDESTIRAIYRYKNEKLGVLNFASAKHPAGGFLVGSMAQEECLAYCSNLYVKQCENALEYYDFHNNTYLPLYSDLMFIDNVTFFRNENLERADFVECKVLTSAAVNTIVAKKNNITDEDIYKAMKNRMKKILQCFVVSDCKVIVLGAFGCGVFGNSSEKIAEIWYDLLYNEDFIYYFDKICFSVLDGGKNNNFKAFENIFKNR